MGRVELGANTDAAKALKVDSSSIARATGGVDGAFDNFLNNTGTAGTSSFINFTRLPTAQAKGATEDANKITYYSPRVQGFQFGVSYTPDQGDTGSATGFTGENNGDYENVFNLGLNYAADISNVEVVASVAGEFGESESAATEDLEAWQAGLKLGYIGFSLAGSYADWGESTLTKAAANDDGGYWDIGLSYETGPYGISVGYLNSELNRNEAQIISVGTDYKLAAGLAPFIEANFFEFDQDGTTIDNEGTSVLAGANVNF